MNNDYKAAAKSAIIKGARTGVQAAIAVFTANATTGLDLEVAMAAGLVFITAIVTAVQNFLEDAPFAFMSKIPKG